MPPKYQIYKLAIELGKKFVSLKHFLQALYTKQKVYFHGIAELCRVFKYF